MLKALVSESQSKPAPRSHDLIYLAGQAGVTFDTDVFEFVSKLNNASVPTRYPADIERVILEYTDKVAKTYLKQTEKVIKWLKSRPELKE